MTTELTTIEMKNNLALDSMQLLAERVLNNADDGVDATSEQITAVVNLYHVCVNAQRASLYWIRQKRAYKQLGYKTFDEFGKQQLGLEKTQLYAMAKAHEIQLSLGNSAIAEKVIPEGQLRELAAVPAEERAAIWECVQLKSQQSGEKVTAKLVREVINNSKFQGESQPSVDENNAISAVQTIIDDSIIDENTLASECGNLVLGCSNAIEIAEQKASDAWHELKKVKDQRLKTQVVLADKITQLFMGIIIDVLD